MKTFVPDNCGNSPRSLLAIDIAVYVAANQYDKLEPLLADTFSLSIKGSGEEIPKTEVRAYLQKEAQANGGREKFEVLSSISHGKFAAVSSCAHTANGATVYSHDLYEFTGAGSSAKLLKITIYAV